MSRVKNGVHVLVDNTCMSILCFHGRYEIYQIPPIAATFLNSSVRFLLLAVRRRSGGRPMGDLGGSLGSAILCCRAEEPCYCFSYVYGRVITAQLSLS